MSAITLPFSDRLLTLDSKELPIRFLYLATGVLAAAHLLTAQAPTFAGCPVLPANNIWNARADSLPVSSNSAAYVQTVGTSFGSASRFWQQPR